MARKTPAHENGKQWRKPRISDSDFAYKKRQFYRHFCAPENIVKLFKVNKEHLLWFYLKGLQWSFYQSQFYQYMLQ